MTQLGEQAKALRAKLANDPHRPQYHFLPPANWMNDPNGLIQWEGQYHLFYQHNPKAPYPEAIHWGHAVSEDLVHWRDLPIALAPTPDGPDKDGCWSGCAVNNDGIPTLVYTGVFPQVQCIATSADGLITWQKAPENPVIATPPPGLDVTGFRDPWVWREGDTWYAIIGSGIKGVGGTILLYRSNDLIHWEYMHPACIGNKDETGTMWECPNLFPLDGKHVLLISPVPLRKTLYLIGTYAHHKFIPESYGTVDPGGHFYAPQTMLDDRGRRLMWGWLWEGRSRDAQLAAGWAGVMSLPRELFVHSNGQLGMRPVPELKALRGDHQRVAEIDIQPDATNLLKGLGGDCLEIKATIEPGNATEFGLKVRCSPDGAEQTRVAYNRGTQQLTIDRTRSSLSLTASRDTYGGKLFLADGEPLQLHIFLDRSVLEVYANGYFCISSRIYPSRADSLGLDLFAQGGMARLGSMDVWTMHSIWDSRG
ncbi:MAG: glycoside hydrolase family 32 protein [Anaerolineae bacterium]|nr:glycoside hydrolase family 32 protein [Anaerolineae bacterium]